MSKTKSTAKPAEVQALEPLTPKRMQGRLEVIKEEVAHLSGALQSLYELHESGGEADPIGLDGLFAVLQRQAWHIHGELHEFLQRAFPEAKEVGAK